MAAFAESNLEETDRHDPSDWLLGVLSAILQSAPTTQETTLVSGWMPLA
jgi:hypothetical protein